MLACQTETLAPAEGDACAPPREAVVARVLDGDTVQLDSTEGEAVRLLGISAPDIGDVAQCFGPESAGALAALLEGQRVRLEFDALCSDRYGRTLAYVSLQRPLQAPDGQGFAMDLLVNAWMVRSGFASVYADFDGLIHGDALQAAEEEARREEAGLWGRCM
jgi:micrococcal nuclease